MKKFVFELEALLGLRRWKEQNARYQLIEISKEVRRLEAEIEQSNIDKDVACIQWNELNSNSFNRNDRIAIMGLMDGLDKKRSDVEESLDKALLEKKRVMENVAVLIRERKAVESLKEKRLEEYRAGAFRQEIYEIEDVYNARKKERSRV